MRGQQEEIRACANEALGHPGTQNLRLQTCAFRRHVAGRDNGQSDPRCVFGHPCPHPSIHRRQSPVAASGVRTCGTRNLRGLFFLLHKTFTQDFNIRFDRLGCVHVSRCVTPKRKSYPSLVIVHWGAKGQGGGVRGDRGFNRRVKIKLRGSMGGDGRMFMTALRFLLMRDLVACSNHEGLRSSRA